MRVISDASLSLSLSLSVSVCVCVSLSLSLFVCVCVCLSLHECAYVSLSLSVFQITTRPLFPLAKGNLGSNPVRILFNPPTFLYWTSYSCSS